MKTLEDHDLLAAVELLTENHPSGVCAVDLCKFIYGKEPWIKVPGKRKATSLPGYGAICHGLQSLLQKQSIILAYTEGFRKYYLPCNESKNCVPSNINWDALESASFILSFKTVAAKYFFSRYGSPLSGSQNTLLTRICQPFDGYAIDKITTEHIETIIEEYKSIVIGTKTGTMKPSTVTNRINLYFRIFDFAMRHGMIKSNPCHPLIISNKKRSAQLIPRNKKRSAQLKNVKPTIWMKIKSWWRRFGA